MNIELDLCTTGVVVRGGIEFDVEATPETTDHTRPEAGMDPCTGSVVSGEEFQLGGRGAVGI